MTRIKICGLTRQQDVRLAAELGADYLGFVFEPTSPRCFPHSLEVLAGWLRELGADRPRTVGVWGRVAPDASTGLDITQYVEGEPPIGPEPWPVIRPRPGLSWQAERERATRIQARIVVLDAFSPDAYGGTGRRLDAAFVREAKSEMGLPVMVAGGLNPENAAEIVREAAPYGVDVSSGIEASRGIKDPDLLRKFILAVRSADASPVP